MLLAELEEATAKKEALAAVTKPVNRQPLMLTTAAFDNSLPQVTMDDEPTAEQRAAVTMIPYRDHMIYKSHHTGHWWVQREKLLLCFVQNAREAREMIDHAIEKARQGRR